MAAASSRSLICRLLAANLAAASLLKVPDENLVAVFEAINKTAQHAGGTVQLAQAELIFETHPLSFSLAGYKLREGFVEGGCKSIDPDDPDRDCFDLYKAAFTLDDVSLFCDRNGNGVFDDSDDVHDEASCCGSDSPPLEVLDFEHDNVMVHRKRYKSGFLAAEYFAATGEVSMNLDGRRLAVQGDGSMLLRPDSLEVIYTADISPRECNGVRVLVFECSFYSKSTHSLSVDPQVSTIDGLTFGELNTEYLVWARKMLATGSSGWKRWLNLASSIDAEVLDTSGKGEKGVVTFARKLKFSVEVPKEAASVAWDPTLGSTEFGAQLRDTTGPLDDGGDGSFTQSSTSEARSAPKDENGSEFTQSSTSQARSAAKDENGTRSRANSKFFVAVFALGFAAIQTWSTGCWQPA